MTQTIPSRMQFNIQTDDTLTWNVEPLMHEIRHALKNLLEQEQSSVIDLRSLPLAPGEEQKILDMLGRGEVSASLNALGDSEVYETTYPGVWLVTHYNDNDDIVGRFIEVTTIPEILMSQRPDITDAHERLVNLLDTETLSEH